MLWGCQQKQDVSVTHEQLEDLVMKNWGCLMLGGDGNEDGYYHITMREGGDYTISNLCYYDYASKKEVFVCDQTGCQHNDKTCTSYLEGIDGLSELFVYKDHVYIMESGTEGMMINALGEFQKTAPRLFQMDLDGQNRKILTQLEEGYSFDCSQLILANDILYMPIVKTEQIEIKESSYLQVNTQKDLYAIDLTNGDKEQICSLKDKSLVGVEGRNIVLENMHYQDDPQKYLDNRDYQGYDKAMLNYTIGYQKINVDTKQLSDEMTPPKHQESGVYYGNRLYWLEKGSLVAFDLSTGKEEKLFQLDHVKDDDYLEGFLDEYACIGRWIEDEVDGHQKNFYVSLKDGSMKENTLCKSTTHEPITILAQTSDSFLVNYDHDAHLEKSWAGTDQYEIDRYDYALIKKEDYFQSRANYDKIEILDIERVN